MKYTKRYQQTRDIDWFFRDGDRLVHVASNGGLLPDFVNDMDILRQIQTNVAKIIPQEGGQEVIVNSDYVTKRFELMAQRLNREFDSSSIDDYLRSFYEMAQKGFYSYDRDLEDPNHYSLICFPHHSRESAFAHIIPEKSTEVFYDSNERKSFRVVVNSIEKNRVCNKSFDGNKECE